MWQTLWKGDETFIVRLGTTKHEKETSFTSQRKFCYFCRRKLPIYKPTIQVCVEGTLSLAITFIKPLPVMLEILFQRSLL